jgi:hypothetical protein
VDAGVRARSLPVGLARPGEAAVTVRRLIAIAVVFIGSSVAWNILGTSLLARTGQFDGRLEQEVQLLWGAPHTQVAPSGWVLRPDVDIETVETNGENGRVVTNRVTRPVQRQVMAPLDATTVVADLDLEYRRKGLLWYSTYSVVFTGNYRFRNPDPEPREFQVRFPLPAQHALFDDFVFSVNGQPAAPLSDISKEIVGSATVPAGAAITVDLSYRSRGMNSWRYSFASEGAAQVRNFDLTLRTNFTDIDFPAGTISPVSRTETPDGWALRWTFTNLISGQAIGMTLPERLNPGPFAARVTFFAPVSLLFFLTVMVMLGATSGPALHPMHYWFIAAAFFAFHLLLAYLVDHVTVSVAFAIAAAVSLGLVVSYLRVVTGMRHALFRAGAAQAIFLVLFSYAFFFEGFTGLAITIGAIVTLFVLMQMTARVAWEEVFDARRA